MLVSLHTNSIIAMSRDFDYKEDRTHNLGEDETVTRLNIRTIIKLNPSKPVESNLEI